MPLESVEQATRAAAAVQSVTATGNAEPIKIHATTSALLILL